MIKRKGQIVPRSLIKVTPRKLQHKLRFGCDVEIVNKKIKVLDAGDGFLFNLKKRRGLKPNRVTKPHEMLPLKLNGNGHIKCHCLLKTR